MFNTSNKIAIIGPYPPPYGGISVHIKRIIEYIPTYKLHVYNNQKQSNYGKKFYGLFKYWYLLKFALSNYKIIHYHSTSAKVRLILSFIALFKKGIYLHLHGASFSDTLKQKSITSMLLKLFIKKVNILASNDKIYDEIKLLNPKSIEYVDAFIPPKFCERTYQMIFNKIDFPNKDYIISMVGWFTFYKNEDLYGYDIMLKALYNLKTEKNINATIISSVNGIQDEQCYQDFIQLRKKLKLTDRFLLIREDLDEIYPLFLHSDIFVRPTNTDGNSVSIKEALWFGCNVIASDAVTRPSGTTLFKTRDVNDLSDKIEYILKNRNMVDIKTKLIEVKGKSFSHHLIEKIYGLGK